VSWQQLLDIQRLNEEHARAEPELRRLACPHDGTPYEAGPEGELFCRHCGYQPDN